MAGATTTWTSRLLDLLFEDPAAGRCLVAPDGSVLRVNAEWLRSVALSLDEVLGADVADLFAETRDATLAMHARARAGHHVDAPRRAQRRRGTETWWEDSVDPVPMEGGTGLLVTAREIGPGRRSGPGADEGARSAADLLEATLASMTQGVMVYGRSGEVLRINSAAERILGVSQAECIAADGAAARAAHLRLQTPDGLPFPIDETPPWRALRGQSSREVSMVLHKRTAEATWLSVSAAPIRGPDGTLHGAVTTFSDVTDRRRIERALRDAQQLLQSTMDHFPTAIAFKDREGRFLDVNKVVEDVLGMPKERIVGRTDHDLFPKERADANRRWDLEVMESREPIQREEITELGIGAVRHLDTRFPLVGTAGDVYGVGHISHDLTQVKRAEQAMRDSEELYRSLFTLAPSGVVLNDAEGCILAFNDTAHEQLGYTREEFATLRLSDVDAHEKPPDVRRRTAQIAAAGGAEYEVQHRTKTGETRDVLVRTRPVEIAGERRFLNVWQDITDRKRGEAALRDADRRKTEFLAMLSHELRNPLAPIRNSIYLLERAAPGTEQASRAKQVVRRQTEHLTRLIDELLDVTRISRGKVDLHPTRLDLREVVRKTADDFHSVFEQAGVMLRVDLGFAPVWVAADATRIAQVVGNLLHNAVKFTASGGEVTVGITPLGPSAELYVRDTGVGMVPDQIERMFEPFAQADQNLARTKGGLGLGLALVKGLVELHGGSVRARSEGTGRGAEFVVTLPSSATPAPAPQGRRDGVGGPGRVVLIVEDNVDAGQSLAEILQMSGHRVRIARDGRSGVELARELRPDVVLCDIGLPDLDGYEVARTLRRDEALRGMRLVALSGYAQPEDRQRARDAGFDAHLAKPPDIDALIDLLASDA